MDEQRTKAESGAVAREADLQPTYTDKDGTVHQRRILTGDRTTGKLHLGHYVGSLRNRVKYQSVYDTFILMADVQALTTHWEQPEILKQSVMDVALDYLAAGLDPYTGGVDDGSKAKVAVQSHIPSIAELTVLYGLVTPMSIVLDNPTTKAEAQQYGMSEIVEQHSREYESNNLPLSPEYYSDLHSSLVAEFQEIGDVNIPNLKHAYLQVMESSDVSVRKIIDDAKRYKDYWLKLLDSTAFRREIRNTLVGIHRSAGVRQMSYGFLGYPVSQAADITFVNAHLVPVGEDQVPHIELTREIVRRMNKQYGKQGRILIEPQALLGGSTIKGLDGNAKMSKSLGNAVYLSDSDEDIWDKVRKAVTDPQRIRKDDPGRPEICNVFSYHQQFNAETEPNIRDAGLDVPTVDETAELCRSAGVGCVQCKKNLAAKLKALLEPMRERRADWEQRPDDVRDILREGTRRGNEEGDETVARVKDAMHVKYW